MPAIYLAGLPVPGSEVFALARLVDDADHADRLEGAYGRGASILALEIAYRDDPALADRLTADHGARRSSRRPSGRARGPSATCSCSSAIGIC